MSAYAHPVASVKQIVFADVHNTCLTYTPAHAWCSQHLSKMHAYSPQKMHMDACMRAYAMVQKLLCHGSYCELILSLARVSCRLSFVACSYCLSCCLDQTRRPTLFAQKNPCKSTLAAAAVSHKHHSIIRVGAGLILFVCGSHSRLAGHFI